MTAVAVIGDSDSHGGSVTSGSSKTFVAGIGVATVGSEVSPDPIPGHVNKTITSPGNSGKTTVEGKQIASEGALVSCGATINTSHNKTLTA